MTAIAASLLPFALAGQSCTPDSAAPSGARPAAIESGAETEAAKRTVPPPGFAESVLLVTIDTLRADALGFSGNSRVETPILNRLASEGWVFENALAHAVMTLPSHASLLTGRLPYQHQVRDNGGFFLDTEIPTLATLLGSRAFAAAAFVAAFPLDARYGLNRGFDPYDDHYPEGIAFGFEMAERRGDVVVTRAREWWQAHSGEKRFLWVHLYDPHAPYQPPEPWATSYAHSPYLGEVAATDSFLEPLLAPLLDAEEPVLIVLTSDHGESLGEHGEQTHGLFAYQATLAVPLVLWHPALTRSRVSEVVGHVDLLPTILEAVGLTEITPPDLPGRSLLGPSPDNARPVYFEALNAALARGWAPLRGVVRGAYKYVSLPEPELYHLIDDPAEQHNLFERQEPLAGELEALLPEESSWPPLPETLSDEEQRALSSLGYLSSGGGRRPNGRVFSAADDPKNLIEIDQMLQRFTELHGARKLGEAADLAREVVRRRPDMAIGYYQLAQVLLDQDRIEEALGVMAEARRRGLASASLSRQTALTLAQIGRTEDALSLLEPLAATGDPDTLTALGLVLAEDGQLERARSVLHSVFERDPRNPLAHQNLALVAVKAGKWPDCERQAAKALEINPRLPLAWNYLGLARYNLGRRRDAVQAWERSVEIQPNDFDVLYNLGTVAAELGQREIARRALQRFVDDAPRQHYRPDIERARAELRRLDR